MKHLLLLLLACLPLALPAQTIVELKPGGKVRNKTVEDYRDELRLAEIERQDSLLYVDHLRRAFNALSTDSLEVAEQRFEAALKLRPAAPGNYIVHYNLALIDMAYGRWAPAIERLSSVVRTHPTYHAARIARAEAELQGGRPSEAIGDASALLDPAGPSGIEAGVLRRARFVRGAAYYALHRYAEARTDLTALLQQEPDNENARLLQALILEKTGQPKEALNQLNLIVAAHPESIDALQTRATLLQEQAQPALARADYDRLVALAPEEPAFYIERARCLIQLEELRAARLDLDKAVSLGASQGEVQALYRLTR